MGGDVDDRGRWNVHYSTGTPGHEPAPFLVERASLLPPAGVALDVAGGAGRNAIWLAQQGLAVTLVDVSDVACALASERAAAAGVPLRVVRSDLGHEQLPAGPWDVILIRRYLDRGLLAAAPDLLALGGVLLVGQPTVRNLERHDRPPRRWLLEPGELGNLVDELDDVEVVELTEGWTDEGRHEARLVLRRVGPAGSPRAND